MQRVGRGLPFSNFISWFIYSTIAGTVVGSLLEFFAEIDLNGQFRAHDVSVWLAQDTPSPNPSYDSGQ